MSKYSEHSIFSDLVILEFASVLAGPGVGMFFAELGAKVIKIEHKKNGGDVTRSWKHPDEKKESDISAYFSSVNWGKESIALDLSEKEDYAFAMSLVKQADIALVSFAPGGAKKLRLDEATLRDLNSSLIYGEINGYGKDSKKSAFDAVVQAESGFFYLNGTTESGPVKMPVALMDILASHQLREGLLIALMQRQQNGEGSNVSVSLYEAALASLANQATNWLHAGISPQRLGSDHPNIFPYGTVFYAKESAPLVLAVGNDKQFENLCTVLTLPELTNDHLFSTNTSRVKNKIALKEKLQLAIGEFSREKLLLKLEEKQIPAAAIKSIPEVFDDNTSKIMLNVDQENGITFKGVKGNAFRSENFHSYELTRPPHYNEHAQSIREWLKEREENG